MKHAALLLACCVVSGLALGQVTGIHAEVIANHDTTGIPGLEGMKTYHVYAQMTNATDELSAVFGDIATPLHVNSTEGFYQSALGADFGWALNAAVLPFFPEANYDSWFTIGATNNSMGSLAGAIGLDMALASFNSGGNFIVDDAIGGSVFTLLGDANAVAGADERVLIAQLTTAGEITGSVNVQMFIEGLQSQSEQVLAMPIQLPQGCGDAAACNYDPAFGPEDTSECSYPDDCSDCDGNCIDANGNGTCDCDEFPGCTNPMADNYDSAATSDDGSCIIGGCMYMSAANYNPEATYDDQSCVFAGCTNAMALNFDPAAILEDGSCLYLGCMDPVGLNFDPVANVSGACDYSAVCMSDLDGDGYVDVFDLLLMFEAYGYSCE
jgi:hypothetical protein